MKGFENDFDDSNRFFVKSAGPTPKRTTTPKMKKKKMRRRSGRSDDDDEVFFFFFVVGEEGDARLLRPPNPSSPSIFLLSSSNKQQQRGEGGKKIIKKRNRKNRRRRSFLSFFLPFSSVFCFDVLIFSSSSNHLKISSYQGKKKSVSHAEKKSLFSLIFYIAPHKTRAQNAKHSPLSRSKIHIFDS